ncbi:MAG: hypothetical protein IJU14_00730 [Clostridia bacterium]|nr:hypothetical protein [Clostridia bacterium]
MKRSLSVILIVTMAMILFTACAKETTDEDKNNQSTNITEQTTESTTTQATEVENSRHTLYFKDSSKSDKAVATFFHSISSKSDGVVCFLNFLLLRFFSVSKHCNSNLICSAILTEQPF